MSRAGRRPKSFLERVQWLLTRDGQPVLITIVVGIVIGFLINGALGLLLATIAGFAVLKLFNRLPIRLMPWQAAAIDVSPILAKICFMMIFLLPVASYLTLPSGHSPNTLTKYLSIVIAIPDNLISKPSYDVFPGFAIIVIASMVMMFWGSLNLGKARYWLLALGGLLLYTFSPTISSILTGDFRLRIIMSFFSIGYYLAWAGLILMLVSKILPRFLTVETNQLRGSAGMLSILPPVVAVGFLSQLIAGDTSGQAFFIGGFDFESTHHFVAGVFSAGIAGVGGGVIVDQAGDYDYSDETEEQNEPEEQDEPEDQGEPEESPLPIGPQPYSGTDVPEGSTIEYNPDGSITVRCPDGTVGTKFPDGREEYNLPDGTKATVYSDGTTYTQSPDGSITTEYPDGSFKTWSPDGYQSSLTINEDGTMDVTSGDGDTLHFPKEGPPVGALTGKDGTRYTFNEDGTATVSSPYGGTVTMDKDGNFSGTFTTEDGTKLTINNDGSMEAETTEGDKISVNAEGLKATMKNGDFLKTDPDGNPIEAHISGPEGTLDIHTDETGTHIKGQDKEGTIESHTDPQGNTKITDGKGNTTNINPDGSGSVAGPDGNGSWDASGNGQITTPDGTTWTAKDDGSVSVVDKNGNWAETGKDGSLTVNNNGAITTYTPEQVSQMQVEATKMRPADNSGGNQL